MLSLSEGGAISRSVIATLRLIDSFRRLPTNTATSYTEGILSPLKRLQRDRASGPSQRFAVNAAQRRALGSAYSEHCPITLRSGILPAEIISTLKTSQGTLIGRRCSGFDQLRLIV